MASDKAPILRPPSAHARAQLPSGRRPVLGDASLRVPARLDVEHAFFKGADAGGEILGGYLGGVEAGGLAFGVAVECGEQVSFQAAREFLGASFGCLDFGAYGGRDGFYGSGEIGASGWL